MYTFVILIARRLNYYTKLFIPLCHKNEKGRKRKIEMQQRNNHRHSRKKSLNKIHKSADRLKTRTPFLPTVHCVQASPFIPRQTRSPFTPIESRPFLRDPRFFRFVESSYTQYPTQRVCANLVTREAFTWPSPYSRSGEIPKKTHLGGSRRVLALHVGCGTTLRERERELPSSRGTRE